MLLAEIDLFSGLSGKGIPCQRFRDFARRSVGLRLTPKHPAARGKKTSATQGSDGTKLRRILPPLIKSQVQKLDIYKRI